MKKYFRQIFSNRIYVAAVLVIMLLAYGYFLIRPGIYIDDISCAHYVEEYFYLRQGRWGLWLVYKLLPLRLETLWVARILAFIFQAVYILLLNALMLRACDKPGVLTPARLLVFDAVYVTYSLVNEILFFSSTYWLDVFGEILVLCAVGLVLYSRKLRPAAYLAAVVLSAAAVSMFEANAGVFIAVTVILLMLSELSDEGSRFSRIILQGILAVAVLAAALVVRTLIGKGLAAANGVTLDLMHQSTWSKGLGFMLSEGLARMLAQSMVHIGAGATIYLPMLEIGLALAAMLFFIIRAIVKKRGREAFLWLMTIVATLSLNFAVGEVTYNRANYFVYALIIAFVCMNLFMLAKRKAAVRISAALMAVTVLLQGADLVKWETVNYDRWQLEEQEIKAIGKALADWDIENKPVIFTGSYTLPEEVTRRTYIRWYSRRDAFLKQIFAVTPPDFYYEEALQDETGYKVNETGANSVIDWGMGLNFNSTGSELRDLLAMQGVKLMAPTEEQWSRAIWDCKLMNEWPLDGSIADTGEYIIVNLKQERQWQ